MTPPSTEPQVSIVIPVFNRWDYTERCLRSLKANTDLESVEIIVIDNASSDETVNELPKVQGIRAVRNQDNRGFAKACNQGAALARGRYILFLNNDTEVYAGWLPPMTSILDGEPRVWVVGCKLLFPDGTIQHAGVAFAYGTAYPISPFHLHYKKPADLSDADRLQLMDCVTAACLLIRREVFNQVQGFDERFVNGYEDVDLCLKVRRAGGLIAYTPRTVITHYESVSDGRFRFEPQNVDRLHLNWLGQDWFYTLDYRRDLPAAPQPAARPPVSVIVVAHEALSSLTPSLESVRYGMAAEDELILVDEGSRGASALALEVFAKAHTGRVRLVRSETFEGYPAAVRRGLAAARHERAAVLTANLKVPSGWLDRFSAHLDADAAIGVVGASSDDFHADSTSRFFSPTPADVLQAEVERAVAGQRWIAGALQTPCLFGRTQVLRDVTARDGDAIFGAQPAALAHALGALQLQLTMARDVAVAGLNRPALEDEMLQGVYAQRQSVNLAYEQAFLEWGGNVPAERIAQIDGSVRFAPAVGVASVIIPVCNNLDLTRACVDSLYAHTHRDFELVIVDNGSDVAIREYLAGLGAMRGNVRVIRNEANQGFAYACNQGLAAARGDYLVLLNNDVQVTPGWLSRMMAVLDSHPRIGVVGPRAAACSGSQLVRFITSHDPAHAPAFAEKLAVECAGMIELSRRLVGLCLIMRRELLDRVGGFDTVYGYGNCEDDDLLLRVKRAGYLLALAHDVYVHHHGSATFKERRLDPTALARQNWEIFCEKWEHQSGDSSLDALELLSLGQGFVRARDHVPLDFASVFSPGVQPLDIDSGRPLRILCVPDFAGDEWQEPLERFLATFTGADPVCLVVRVDPPTTFRIKRAESALRSLLNRCGANAPEVLLEATHLYARDRGRLYTAASALLPCPGPRAPFFEREARACGTVVLAQDPATWRAALGGDLKTFAPGLREVI